MPANSDPSVNGSNPQQENQYGGVDQRTYPTLLPDDVYTYSEGVVYRSGKAARVNGKILLYQAASPVLAILQTLEGYIIQTATQVLYFPLNFFFPIPSESNTLQADPSGELLQAQNQAFLQPDN